jgi:hypothetical protein
MAPHDILRRQAGVPCDLAQIGREFVLVTNGDLDGSGGSGARFDRLRVRQNLFDFRFDCVEAGQRGIEENSDRGVTWRQFDDPRDSGRLQLAQSTEDRIQRAVGFPSVVFNDPDEQG